MVDLDDLSVYPRLDPQDQKRHLEALPRECRQAWDKGLGFPLPWRPGQFDQMVICGMGGSAIAGDFMQTLAFSWGRLPVWVHRDYGTPPFVGRRTLVVASSYSGNTEETLSAFGQALKAGTTVLALTSGGRLRDWARETGVPCYVITYQSSPRAAVAHSLLPLIAFSQRLGFLPDLSQEVDLAIEAMGRLLPEIGPAAPAIRNPAKSLAQTLLGKPAVIYGSGFLAPVARRWKTQINENSKAWAFWEVLPEANHNAVVGLHFPRDMRPRVLLLRSPLLPARLLQRLEITEEVLRRAEVSFQVVAGRGEGQLAHLLSLVYLGDFVSYYLALLNEVDPHPVAVIDFLKERLAAFPFSVES